MTRAEEQVAPVTQADLEWWLEKAASLEWIFAKTYAQTAPHEYVVLGRTQGITREDFVRAGRVIRTFGQPGKFWHSTNIYLTTDDGWKFWTMDEQVTDTDLINRATVDKVYGPQDAPSTRTQQPTFYDGIASAYDRMWTSPSDLEENRAITRLITRHFGAYAPTTLDVGCGTGLLLDMGITSPAIYTGVDPSQGMLNELVRKHPKVASVLPGTAAEVLPRLEGGRYDLVCSLFAAASYLGPEDYERMASLRGSMLVLMAYEIGYVPDYYVGQEREEALEMAARANANLGTFARVHGAEQHKIGKFDVFVVR